MVRDAFDWAGFRDRHVPFQDLVIYELHVRGFTQHASSGVRSPGTFAGLMEKIPYLVDLGVNAVELMPIFEFDEMADRREIDGRELLNYWATTRSASLRPTRAIPPRPSPGARAASSRPSSGS